MTIVKHYTPKRRLEDLQGRILTTKELKVILSCSERHLQRLRDQGRLTFIKDGSFIRYRIEDVLEYLDQHVKPSYSVSEVRARIKSYEKK